MESKVLKNLVFFSLISVFSAFADVPLPPEAMNRYTVRLDSAMSDILLASTNFMSSREVSAERCPSRKVQEKKWEVKAPDGSISQSLVCTEKYYCMGSVPASCQMTFIATKDASEPSRFLYIVKSEPVID